MTIMEQLMRGLSSLGNSVHVFNAMSNISHAPVVSVADFYPPTTTTLRSCLLKQHPKCTR